MESDLQHHHQKQMNSSLMRYQSAPSSYLSSFLDREFYEEILNQPSSPETERIFAQFLLSSSGNTDNITDQNFGAIRQSSPVKETAMEIEQKTQIIASMNNVTGVMQQQQQSSYSSASQSFYQTQNQQHLSNQSSGLEYRLASNKGIDQLSHTKMEGGSSNSTLIRHSSSPAGLFSHINVEDGYAVMRGMGDFGGGNSVSIKREAQFTSASRPLPSSSGLMNPMAEIGNKNMGANSPDNGGFGDQNLRNNYTTGLPIMSDSISGAKRLGDIDWTLSGPNFPETKNLEAANRPPSLLAHHLSLPKFSAEMNSIEKFLQLQDSVPCKIRAKRGFATHPRSIAERVRRTRITERMRKLQDLVPKMDKQTNTSDMLDLAVEYIKDLQKQVKTLSDIRAKCTCSNKQQQQ